MSIVAAQLVAKVHADTEPGERGLHRVAHAADEAHQHLEHAGEGAHGFVTHLLEITGAMAAFDLAKEGIHLVVDQLGEMVHAGMEANRTEALTDAVLKSTGGSAGVTSQAVGDLAMKYMNMTGVQDDAVRSAENMLLTFTNIHSNVFPQTTKAVLDMATAMGGGAIPNADALRATAIQVGKALQDPIKGVTALQRVGVRLSEQQKQQVKDMMAVGDTAGAQGVILKELATEFGGASDAAGQANGGMAILSAQFDQMKQTIGQAIIPILIQFMTALTPITGELATHLPGALKTVTDFLSGVLAPVFAAFSDSVEHVDGPIDKLRGHVHDTTDVLVKHKGIISQVKDFLGQLADLIQKQVVPAAQNLWHWFQEKILPGLTDFAIFVRDQVVPVLLKLWTWFNDKVLPVLEKLFEVFVDNVLPAIKDIWQHISDKLIPSLQHLWEKLAPILIPALELLGWTLQHVVGPAISAIIDLVSTLTDKLTAAIDGMETLTGGANKAWSGKDLTPGDYKKAQQAAIDMWNNPLLHLAGGGTTNGMPFLGAEEGPELLVKPGIYSAPRGSRVFNAQDTARLLGGHGGHGGNTYITNVYPQQAILDTQELARIQLRRELLRR